MEGISSTIPIILFIVVVIVFVRWYRAAKYLRYGGKEYWSKKSASPSSVSRRKSPDATPKTQKDALEDSSNTYKSSIEMVNAEVGGVQIDLSVSDEEIEPQIQEWAFLFEGKRPKQLKGTQIWFKQRNHNKYLKTDPDRALDWARPFFPVSVLEHERLRPLFKQGLVKAPYILGKELREMVQECRKNGTPHRDLLLALYGLRVLNSLDRHLSDLYRHASLLTDSLHTYVALEDLKDKPVDYQKIGFNHLTLPYKTEPKWFVQEFGEPDDHIPISEFYADACQQALSRGCWRAFQQSWNLKGTADEVKANMEAWLRTKLKDRVMFSRVRKEDDEQRALQRARKQTEIEKRSSGPFAGFEPMSFYTHKVVGVSHTNSNGTSRQKYISKMREGDKVILVRDPDNPADGNAIQALNEDRQQIGFIDRSRASELAPQMDNGYVVEAWVDRILGGESGKSYGVVIGIQRHKPKV